jgi:hypothetical protein
MSAEIERTLRLRYRREVAWEKRAAHAEAHGIGNRPTCGGCGLVKGIGWRDAAGHFSESDPEPSAAGVTKGGGWFCTTECQEHHDQEHSPAS